eukprot:g51869.t1
MSFCRACTLSFSTRWPNFSLLFATVFAGSEEEIKFKPLYPDVIYVAWLLEERKQKGIIIDAARTSWLRAPCQQEHIDYFLQERIPNPSHKTLAKNLWLRDKQKRAEGWIPVLVQGVVWSRKLNLCGTCDVLWFHPAPWMVFPTLFLRI